MQHTLKKQKTIHIDLKHTVQENYYAVYLQSVKKLKKTEKI